MGSETTRKLPVIDMCLKDSSSWDTKCGEVRRALEEYGCFIATYDGVSVELRDAIFHDCQELFDLPTEVKASNVVETPYNGYIGQQPLSPLYESLGIENATTREAVESFTKLMWPEGHQSFCENALKYSKAVGEELHPIVMKMITQSYGIEENYESIKGATTYLLKPTKYIKSPKENEATLGILPHTDKCFMTYLYQNDVNGLEIMAKDGEWFEVDYDSHKAFVVMAADGFTAWTNGRIKAPVHRVMMSGKKERYVLGLFTTIRGQMIRVPQQLIDEDHPRQFRDFDNYEYMQFYYTPEGLRSECPIKSYCGI